MIITASTTYARDPTEHAHLASHLEWLTQSLAPATFTLPPESDPKAHQRRRRDLDDTIKRALEASDPSQRTERLSIPPHVNYLDLRPASVDLGHLRDTTSTHVALGRFEDYLFNAITGWAIGNLLNRVHYGAILAPTTLLSRSLDTYPSPYARYIALLDLSHEAGILKVPTLLVGFTIFEHDPEIPSSR
jgi:hypothetical protein